MSRVLRDSLNESPYEKVGKFWLLTEEGTMNNSLNESPYEKVGKYAIFKAGDLEQSASMKVPTKK